MRQHSDSDYLGEHWEPFQCMRRGCSRRLELFRALKEVIPERKTGNPAEGGEVMITGNPDIVDVIWGALNFVSIL